jgi:enoyl-CoA hydratase
VNDVVVLNRSEEDVTVLRLSRGANTLDEESICCLDDALAALERDGAPALVVCSAHTSVFSPGLDLKRLDGQPRDVIRRVMVGFNALLRRLAVYPAPTVAAVAGHAIAGGCLLALACDRRVMARSGARIGLSEVNLGIPVPAGAVAMLVALYQTRAVEQLVLEGDGFGGERALELGLVERLAAPGEVLADARRLARHLASRPRPGWATAKAYLRHDLARVMEERDTAELERFLDHWFEAGTQDRLGALVASMSH